MFRTRLFTLTFLCISTVWPQTATGALVADDPVQCWFNHPVAQSFAEPPDNRARGNVDLEAVLMELTDGAQRSLDIAVFDFDLPGLAEALARARARGVQVRVIVDQGNSRPFLPRTREQFARLRSENARQAYLEEAAEIDTDGDGQLSAAELRAVSDMAEVLDALDAGQVPWIDDAEDGTRGSDLMHHKYMIIDGEAVLTGSTNWTEDGIHGDDVPNAPDSDGNANNMILIHSPAIAAYYQRNFSAMWGDGPGGQSDSRFGTQITHAPPGRFQVGDARIMVQFSPYRGTVDFSQTTNGTIARMIRTSQRSAHLCLFVFSNQAICDALHDRWTNVPGYDLAGVFEPSFFRAPWSETLDMNGVQRENTRSQRIETDSETDSPNLPWERPCPNILRARLHPWDSFHHKYAILDGTLVITGSHNWSASGNRNNDENTVFIIDPLIANQYEQEFQARMAEARDETRTFSDVPPRFRPQPREETPEEIPQGAIVVEDVTFTSQQAEAVLELVNSARMQELDLVVGLDRRAAQNIIDARPIANLEQLAGVSWVGPSALRKLREAVE